MSARLTSPSLPLSKSPFLLPLMDRDTSAPALISAALAPVDNEETALAFLESATIPKAIPQSDLGEFHGLTARNQMRVLKFLEAVKIIEAEPVKMRAYDLAAAFLAGMRGASASRIRVMYGEFMREGRRDWRAFIDGALEYKPTTKLPAEFLRHMQDKVDAAKRDRAGTAAINKMLVEWTMGAALPGFGTWKQLWKLKHPALPMPSVCPWQHPPGCSPRNLRNYLDTSKARRMAQVQGLAASDAHKPLVYTTRRGLHCAAVYEFDDLWHDFFVACPGIKKAGRPLEFFCHDLFSARKVRFGFRIRTEDDNGKMEGLTLRMMRMLLASVMACDGYSPRGTKLIAEHGTAAITEDMERLLYDASGGLITVHRSGMQGRAAHDGQYGGVAKGNPRRKASLESSNKTVHALTADAPGQTGTNRDTRPEELGALLKYNEQLMAAAATLPPHLRELLRYPLLTEEQAGRFLSGIYACMDSLPFHTLEGWEDNTVAEAFVLNTWLDAQALQALPADDLAHVMARMQAGSVETRQRRLTRGEVWQRGSGELVRLSGSVICHLLGDEFSAERTVRNHKLEFQDKEIGPGVQRFEAWATDAEGIRHELTNGERYLVTVNPFAADELFLRDAKGRYIGTAKRLTIANANDMDAIHRALGEAAKLNKELLEPLRKRQAGEARARLNLMQHNAGVVGSHQAAEAAAIAENVSALSRRAKRAAPAPAASPISTIPSTGSDW